MDGWMDGWMGRGLGVFPQSSNGRETLKDGRGEEYGEGSRKGEVDEPMDAGAGVDMEW